VPTLAVRSDDQARVDLASDVAQLYMQEQTHAEIGAAVNLTGAQAHKILTALFAEGMPKLKRRRLSDEKVRAIHAAWFRGDGSIAKMAEAIGFKPSTARRRMRKLELLRERQSVPSKPARSRAHAEQRVITGLLMARVDELRKPLGLSYERLAGESGVSIWTLTHLRSDLTDPRLSVVLRLCRGLGVTVGELLHDLPLPVEPRPRRSDRAARVAAETRIPAEKAT
jgi:transcriptional regulator with XRE-family HTH domain